VVPCSRPLPLLNLPTRVEAALTFTVRKMATKSGSKNESKKRKAETPEVK